MSFQYENGTIQTLLDSGLNSLADGNGALSSAYDNDDSGGSNLYLWGIFELFINSFGSAPTEGELVDMYFIDSLNGTDFADGSGGSSPVANPASLIASFPVRAVTSDQRIVLPSPITLPSCDFKVLLINNTGQAFPSSGNTLKMLPVRFTSS